MDIEKMAVSTITMSISETDIMSPFINDSDKEPTWDGNIYIYANKSKSKEGIKKVPVQIKGKIASITNKNTISYPIEVVDLNNYLNDGGVFFFVVYLSNNGKRTQIYYSSLLPVKLQRIISELKQGQKTKSIEFKKFPNDNNLKTAILLDFYNDMQKQTSFRHNKLLSPNELIEQGVLDHISFAVTGYGSKDNLVEYVLNKDELYLYAKIKGSDVLYPLKDTPNKLALIEEELTCISIDGKVYYDRVKRIKTKETIEIKIGHSIIIVLEKSNEQIQIKLSPTTILQYALIDFQFIIAWSKHKSFVFDKTIIETDMINDVITQDTLNNLIETLDYYQKINRLFDELNLNKDYDISKMTHEDKEYTNKLINGLIFKKPIHFGKNITEPVALIDYVNTKIALVFNKAETPGEYYISNYFGDNNFEIIIKINDRDDGVVPVSKYVILNSTNFLEIGNINYNVITESLFSFSNTPYAIEYAINLLLQMLLAYDINQNRCENILIYAEKIASWILEQDSELIVSKINWLQIMKRKRRLNDQEKQELIIITEEYELDDKEQEYSIKTAANLLLDDKDRAKYYYNKLSEDGQRKFDSYPICKFW